MLAGCLDDKPPKGFEAVEPVHFDTSKTSCPTLTGSFPLADAIAQNNLVADWLGVQNPAMATLVFDDWVGSSAFNYRVQMDRDAFLAEANALRGNNPADYYEWRKLILDVLENKTNFPSRDTIAAIEKLGPQPHLRGQTHARGCQGGWMKVLEKERIVQGEENRFTRQWDLWLGHDIDGNLLLQTVVYRQQPGWTFWAAGGAGVRLIAERYQWHKIPKSTGTESAMALRAADLPPVAPPNRSPDCVRDVADMIAHNQQLLAQLPEGATLTQFLPIQGAPTDACNQQIMQVAFAIGPRGRSADILQILKADKRVSELTVKERHFANRQWHVVVAYRLALPERR